MNHKGKLIVIDGLDGSGKSTQFELVQKELFNRNITVKAISFPNYESPSSELIKMYLNGAFSKTATGVNAYAASSFYAVDRYASFKLYWEQEYNTGALILASRYVSSNAIHQMVKLPENEWDNYLEWLMDYEYNKLNIPKADKVIFLDMPIEISQKLLSLRYQGDETQKDIHESDVDYLYKCRKSAYYAAEKLGWVIIKCNDGDEPLKQKNILYKIMQEINGVL